MSTSSHKKVDLTIVDRKIISATIVSMSKVSASTT